MTVEMMNNHPKLMRLPSVSRSLYFSIMPQSCYQMYEKPVILAINPKSVQKSAAPVFSASHKTHKKRSVSYEARPMVRPSANSYIYNKMFKPKPVPFSTQPKRPNTRSRPQTSPNPKTVTFYCEINPPRSAPKRSDIPKSLNQTLMELGDIENSLKKSPSRNSLGTGTNFMIDQQMEIDMGLSMDSRDDLHKISEVHESLEISEDGESEYRAKSISVINK